MESKPDEVSMMAKKTEKCQFMGNHACQSGNAVYGLGFIGSAIYFISTATGFWMGVLGVLKAIVWPSFLVYGVLKFLGL
jgi:hypothetical protein